MNKIILLIFVGLIFGIILLTIKHRNLNSLLFFAGTIGTFIICIHIGKDVLEKIIQYYLMNIIHYASNFMSYLDVYRTAKVLNINSGSESIAVFINYECLAIVEHIAYTVLVLFVPFISKVRSVIYILAGNVYILIANAIRILMIAVLVNTKGIAYYDTAHMIIGRIIFFIFMIILYFLVFTRTHIKNQKIGGRK